MPAEGEAAGPSGRGEREPGAYAAGPDVFRGSPVRYLGYANELGEVRTRGRRAGRSGVED